MPKTADATLSVPIFSRVTPADDARLKAELERMNAATPGANFKPADVFRILLLRGLEAAEEDAKKARK